MQKKIVKTLWKMTKTASVSALSLFLYDLLRQVDTIEELAQLGVPALLIPLGLAAVTGVRNWLKQHGWITNVVQ